MKYLITTDNNSIDFAAWDEFINQHQHGTVFQSSEAYRLFEQTKNFEPVQIFLTEKNSIKGELLGVIDTRKPGWQRAANALSGLKFSTYDATRQRLIDLSNAMEEELQDSPYVREGSYFYVPEDQKALAVEEQEKIRRIGGLHRAMKLLREAGTTTRT